MGNSGRAGQLFAAAASARTKLLLMSVPIKHRRAQPGWMATFAGFVLAWNPLCVPVFLVLTGNDENVASRHGAIYFAHVSEKLLTLGACDPSA
jgi:hypothetical protein